jgi:YHS domain-containing protein
MKRVLFLLLTGFATACIEESAAQPPTEQARTLDNTPVQPLPVQRPATLDEPGQSASLIDAPSMQGRTSTSQPVKTTIEQQDELSRKMNLPFAPAIAMDPVDGSKVSIRPDTPWVEHKGRLYYFSSAKNKQIFVASPDTYLKGKLASY